MMMMVVLLLMVASGRDPRARVLSEMVCNIFL